MQTRFFRLAILAAVSLIVPVATSAAQVIALPSALASAPASTVPDRLLARRAELALSEAQARELAALSAKLHGQEQIQGESSKPWITAQRRPSPQQAFERAVAILTPMQRTQATALVMVLIIVKEGLEGLRGEASCSDCAGY